MKKTLNFVFLAVSVVIFLPLMLVDPALSRLTETTAQIDGQCSEQLSKAETEYSGGHWEEAIKLIEQCLKKPHLSETERGKAYRLLGLVYISIQLIKEANDAVKNLLIMVPNYKVDPAKDPPLLQKIIDNTAQTLNPIVTSITPEKVKSGDVGFTLTVIGKNFVYGSIIKINSQDKSTSYISSNELKAEIPASDIFKEGELSIYVFSPILGGKSSNSEKMIIEKSSTFPWGWIAAGAGAVAAVVAAIFLLKPPGEEETIADPPGRP